MRRGLFRSLAIIAIVPLVLAGCADMSPTLKGGAIGAGVGAGVGAATGAIIDGGSGAGKGAAVGGLVGLVSGLIAGEMYSQSQKQQPEANLPRPPSESYSTTLTPPAKPQSEPLLLSNEALASEKELADLTMSTMKDILTLHGVKFELYTVSSVAKNPNSPVVVLRKVRQLGFSQYEVTLTLVSKDVGPKDFSGVDSTLIRALSQALFGK